MLLVSPPLVVTERVTACPSTCNSTCIWKKNSMKEQGRQKVIKLSSTYTNTSTSCDGVIKVVVRVEVVVCSRRDGV